MDYLTAFAQDVINGKYGVGQQRKENIYNGRKSDEDMIRTWATPPAKSVCGKKVIVIDAGGTTVIIKIPETYL